MDLRSRAALHAALGDERRLLIVDILGAGDRTVTELGDEVGLGGNLLAHHLDVLDRAGLIERRVSEGDHRRRYVSLRWDRLPIPVVDFRSTHRNITFVCSHNSARSQFAAALWAEKTGERASSAGSEPATAVHPMAVRVAHEFGVDLSESRPRGYESLPPARDLIISVCDRANESGLPESRQHMHWSVPDPVAAGGTSAFREAFREIAERTEHLVPSSGSG